MPHRNSNCVLNIFLQQIFWQPFILFGKETKGLPEDILQKYEREKLDYRKKEILKQLDFEKDGEKKKQLGKELSNIIIALAKIK